MASPREERIQAAAAAVAAAQRNLDAADELRVRLAPIPSYRRAYEDALQAIADATEALIAAATAAEPEETRS